MSSVYPVAFINRPMDSGERVDRVDREHVEHVPSFVRAPRDRYLDRGTCVSNQGCRLQDCVPSISTGPIYPTIRKP